MPSRLDDLEGAFHRAPSLHLAAEWLDTAIDEFTARNISIDVLCAVSHAVQAWARANRVDLSLLTPRKPKAA